MHVGATGADSAPPGSSSRIAPRAHTYVARKTSRWRAGIHIALMDDVRITLTHCDLCSMQSVFCSRCAAIPALPASPSGFLPLARGRGTNNSLQQAESCTIITWTTPANHGTARHYLIPPFTSGMNSVMKIHSVRADGWIHPRPSRSRSRTFH